MLGIIDKFTFWGTCSILGFCVLWYIVAIVGGIILDLENRREIKADQGELNRRIAGRKP